MFLSFESLSSLYWEKRRGWSLLSALVRCLTVICPFELQSTILLIEKSVLLSVLKIVLLRKFVPWVAVLFLTLLRLVRRALWERAAGLRLLCTVGVSSVAPGGGGPAGIASILELAPVAQIEADRPFERGTRCGLSSVITGTDWLVKRASRRRRPCRGRRRRRCCRLIVALSHATV